ncbi:PucR family transcriptional regulator [Companilactobacillus insicii]|uniref:PucR family transcriptional regulator n=1 Tax=Companilactobacillus insicii TaxID=1732567 RepID=UPI000F782CA0|nr:PucR family transcriptional regulator ligand-binding domain-containing protein [Companilactobacillus insicii]
MDTSLEEILNLDALSTAKIIAGKSDIKKNVTNIMIMEGHDVEKWVKPGYIILTSLYGYTEKNQKEFIDLFHKLFNLKCSAIIVKLNRAIKMVPQKLIDVCNELNLILITIDDNIGYKDIILPVMQLLFNQNNLLLNHYKNVNQKYIELAASDAKIENLIQQLDVIINNPVGIISGINSIDYVISSRTYSSQILGTSNAKLLRSDQFQNYDYYVRNITQYDHLNPNVKQILVKLDNDDNNKQYLCITESNQTLKSEDYIAIEIALNFINLEILKSNALKNAKKDTVNEQFDEFLSGNLPLNGVVPEIFEEKNFQMNKEYRSFYCKIFNYNQSKKSLLNKKIAISNLKSRCKVYWPKVAYRSWMDQIYILVESDESIVEFKNKIRTIVNYIQKTSDSKLTIQISISNKEKLQSIPKISKTCLNNLQIESKLENGDFIISEDDLGILQLLSLPINKNEILNLLPNELIYMNNKEPELTNTLDAYVKNQTNITQSAEYLYIHPKTMRYRLKKIKSKYAIDLDNPNNIMNMGINIKLLKLL